MASAFAVLWTVLKSPQMRALECGLELSDALRPAKEKAHITWRYSPRDGLAIAAGCRVLSIWKRFRLGAPRDAVTMIVPEKT